MIKVLNKIFQIGIDESVAESEIKYIRLVNALAFVTICCTLGFLPLLFLYLPESLINIYLVIAIVFLISSVLLINLFKYHLIAKIYFGLIGVFNFTAFSILNGIEYNFHLYMVLVIIVSFFIFSKDEKLFMYSIILIALASVIGLEIWYLNHEPIMTYSAEFSKAGSIFMNLGLVFEILGFSFYIYTIYLQAETKLEAERKKSDGLLHNILPIKIANRLRDGSGTIADKFDNTSILFADLIDFTAFSERTTPENLVQILNEIFSNFDGLADKHNLEKIKTIGDAYMVVAGLPSHRDDHAEAIAEFALDVIEVLKNYVTNDGRTLKIRIGINSGPVVAGVIGRKKFIYDLWGDSVNTASRMESHGVPGEIHVTQTTYELLKHKYNFIERGYIDVKSKGQMETYLLKGRKNSL